MIHRGKLAVGVLVVVAALAWPRREPAVPSPVSIVTPAVGLLDGAVYGSYLPYSLTG